jgi:quinolinate synthase
VDIKEKINKLKKEYNATILVHSYQIGEVQDIADFIGDSLGLSIQASKTDADVIVFCGVYFMAETAKIISPDKKVLIPDKEAGCPMADMVTVKELKEFKKKNPGAKYVCYVNTTADVKAECDLCVTSANALKLIDRFYSRDEKIVFLPDKYLGQYVSEKTGFDFIKWNGYCPTHMRIIPQDIAALKKAHPDAKVIVHPECAKGVWEIADEVLSTEGMYRYVKD